MPREADLTDTIVAQATPPGQGALAVLRVSGPQTFSIRDVLAPSLGEAPPRQPVLARLRDPENDEIVDHALVTSFMGPDSYTGEDLMEISCHGGFLVPGLVLECILAAGARMAEPGEFTRRAYLNGKMDLLQAEAVSDLVAGRSRALHRVAVHQMERGLSARVAAAREGLVRLETLLVHHLDFPDEDEPPTDVEEVADRATRESRRLKALLATAPEGELLREGALTVLAGRPNSGKSSIFNALVGSERAIVTDIPGTTRDALEATVSLGGYPFRLVDTAGLRATEERVEMMGIEVAHRYLARADVILFCVEKGEEIRAAQRGFLDDQQAPVVVLRTKADLCTTDREEDGRTEGTGADVPCISVSVRSGEGLAKLARLLPGLVYRELVRAGAEIPVLTRERQRRGIATAVEELDVFARVLCRGVPAEFAATHLRSAETALEDVLGIVTVDEVLDQVFRDFCIGK